MVPNHKGEIPVVVLLIPFLFGIVAGINLFTGVNHIWPLALFILLSIGFIALNILYTKLKLFKYRWLGGSLITVVLFLFGWIIAVNNSEVNNGGHYSKNKAQYLIIKISNEPVLKNGLYRFTAEVGASINNGKQAITNGTILITIKDSLAKSLYYGDILLIPAKYNPIDPPFNPAEFNYKKFLANKNIYYQAFIYPKQYQLLKRSAGNPLINYSLRLRQHLVKKLKANMHDTSAIAVASTLILGYKANLSEDVLQAYSKTGTVFVLSVSGSQVAIIYLLLTLALKFLERHKYGKLLRAVIIISIIWYYAILTGFSLSVCRVCLMVSLVVIGKSFNKYINTLNILAVSAFLLLLYDPFFINDAGFQLSFVAVAGLVILQPVVYKWCTFKNKWASKLWALCSISIAAQIVTFPLAAFYFHQFPVYFLISNLFIVVPAAFIMYAGILYLLLPQIPFVSAAIGFILQECILIMNKGLTYIENAPWASISKIWLTIPQYLLIYIIIIYLFYFLYDRKFYQLKISLFCILLLCISLSLKSFALMQSKSITFLNIKKHQGIILKNGGTAIILSDLKCTDKVYQYSIQPYLDSCQIKEARLYNLNQDINTAWLKKKDGYLTFLNYRLFIHNGSLQNKALHNKLKADYIYLTGNPANGVNVINSNFNYGSIIIDGTNSDRSIEEWSKQLKIEKVNFDILKRNNSLILISN